MAKLLVHPRELKIPPKLRKRLEAEGYIVIAEDIIGSVRVVEPLPEFDLASDNAWLVRTLLQLVVNDDGAYGTKSKFSARLLKRLESHFIDKAETKPALSAVEKAS